MSNYVNLNTRIALKIDELSAWNSSSIVLEKGEVALAVLEANAAYGITEPVVMAKIGDGDHTFSEISDWNFYAKASDVIAACKSEAGLTAFVNNVIKSAALTDNEVFTALAGRVTDAEGDIDDLEAAVALLNNNDATAGSVANSIKVAIEALDATVSSAEVESGKGLKVTVVEADGVLTSVSLEGNFDEVYAAKSHEHTVSEITDFDDSVKAYGYITETDAKAYADGKVASVSAGDASVTVGGTATAPTVAAKLSADANNALTLAEDGLKVVIPDAAEYSIVKSADSGDYAAVYNLTKDGVAVGASINIPKDMVVESGSVVVNPEGQAEGTYIKLVLANATNDTLYIPVDSLIEYVTSGSATGDMVVVNVSDDHKVTATITDGTITLAKLSTEVQTAIGKAHVHDNASVLDGITAQQVTDWDDAVAKEHVHDNATVLDGISATKVAAWDAAEQNAKDYAKTYADGLAGNYATAAQGAKADTALQTASNGLVVEGTEVKIDESVTFVFNCGTASTVI